MSAFAFAVMGLAACLFGTLFLLILLQPSVGLPPEAAACAALGAALGAWGATAFASDLWRLHRTARRSA